MKTRVSRRWPDASALPPHAPVADQVQSQPLAAPLHNAPPAFRLFAPLSSRRCSRFILTLACLALAIVFGPHAALAQFTGNSKLGTGATGVIVTNATGSYSVIAGGQDIFGASDNFTFHNFSSQGLQFDFRARIQSLEANARLTRAGLMVRQSLTTNSRMAFVRVTPTGAALNGETGANDVRFQFRTGTTSAAQGQNEEPTAGFPAPAYPNAWVRLERHGNIIGAYSSTDGVNWLLLGNQDTTTWEGGAFPSVYFLGLAQSRHPSGAKPTNAVEYRNLTITGNFPPVISDLGQISIPEDTSTASLPFTIGDVETLASNLTVSATSGNLTLLPNANFTFGGAGGNRTVICRPATNQTGTAIVTVTVSDGVRTASDRFQLTVTPQNDPPVLSAIANLSIPEDSNTGALPFTITDPDTAQANLTLSGFADQPTLVPTNNIVFGSNATSRTVTVTPALNQFGTTRVTIRASDGAATASETFTLTVTPINDPPTISDITDRTIPANGTLGPIPFTIGDVETPAGSLTLTRNSDNVALVPLAAIGLAGTTATRTVAVTPTANAFGSARITVTVSDGTNSTPDSFVLNVLPIAPTFTSVPQSQSVPEGQPVTFSATATGSPPLTFQWALDGRTIAGATANSFSIQSVKASDGGSYTVTVVGPGGSTSSPPAVLTVQGLDFGDAPETPYPTKLGANGARHAIEPDFFLGSRVDAEPDGQPNSTATGDDFVPTTSNDEDGVRFLTPLIPGQTAVVEVTASKDGRLDAWVDFGLDGDWGTAGDRIFSSRLLVPGANTLTFPVPTGAKIGTSFARFRLSRFGDLNFTGLATSGEVEDYRVNIEQEALDFGDLPVAYPTLLANNGARHRILAGFRLGALIDAEADGQPNNAATGDDAPGPANGDDEDGVTFLSPIVPGQSVRVQVITSAPGRLDAWMDFNGNGSLLDPGEQIFNSAALTASTNTLFFTVPAGIAPRATYARFRLSQQGGLRPEGLAPDGEVEDYAVSIENRQLDFGDAPQNYPVLLSQNGARHQPSELRLGQFLDTESDGQASADALGDDATFAGGPPDDEDGVKFLTALVPGQTAQIEVTVNLPCNLDAWIDFNGSGAWTEANEQIFNLRPLTAGPNVLTFTVPATAISRDTFARFRVSTKGGLSFVGFSDDGEVEDYRVTVENRQIDFGDAPQSYPTLLGNNGARHVIVPGYHLGERIDAEPDGQPSSDALGDDNNPSGADDEDGVRFLGPLIPGQSAAIQVTASAQGVLNAWVDFNINGSWADDLEHVLIDVGIPAGTTTLSFFVPSSAIPRATYARFRFSRDGKISFDGPAPEGEVEDYRVEQGRPRDCDQNCTGTNFWLAFPGNYAPDTNNPVQLSLCLVGTPGTPINVRVPGLGFNAPIAAIPAGGVALVALPRQTDLGETNDVVTRKGVLVRSGAPISVQGLSHVRYTTDGFAAIHTDALGTEYLVGSFANVQTGAADLNGTQFAIVATADNTQVRITPRVNVHGHPAGVPYVITLQTGETYQLRGTEDAPMDLTGTLIESDRPIAVFGGHQCANVPTNDQWFCDYLVEQLLPTKTWGRAFLTAPLATRNGDTFRVLAGTDSTTVTVGGDLVATLNRGEHHQLTLKTGAVIVASAPVSVMQYANSSDFDGVTDADPFMIVVPQVQMFNTDHVVCTAPIDFAANYVNIIAPNAAIGSLTLDGAVVPAAAFTAIGGTLFSYAQRPVSVGVHTISSPSPVGVAIYGWAEYDSYGYPGCLAFGDTTPPTLSCPVTNVNLTLGNVAGAAPCVAIVPDFRTQATYSDNCGLSPNAFPRQDPEPGTIVGPGVHPIRISITDQQGNTATCIITLTVTDPSAPVIRCPTNIVASCTSSNGAVIRYTAGAQTTCIQNLAVICNPPSGRVFPVGTTVVTCVASNAGQTATCAFTVTVKCAAVNIAVNNGRAVVTWDNGTLEGAPTVAGPWGNEPNARSPYTIPLGAPSRYFRVRLDP